MNLPGKKLIERINRYFLFGEGRPFMVALGYRLNKLGVSFMCAGRKVVRYINRGMFDGLSDRFVHSLPDLHHAVDEILARQRREYKHYAYFCGYPYQSLGILSIYGERPTEERFDGYGLADIIKPTDRILDIGCNCGFMALYTAFRTGCSAVGIDINPYMIEIGQRCAEFLNLPKVELVAGKFQEYQPEEKFSVVFSFATHWTDDQNYRVPLQTHLGAIHALLAPGGLLVFETHCGDVGNAAFREALESMRTHFEWDGFRLSDRNTRELYLMRRREVVTAEG
ncbi:MAG: class I SAM-dependent methyltransferase [Bacteroidales bacterium]